MKKKAQKIKKAPKKTKTTIKKHDRREYLMGGLAAAATFLVYLRALQNRFINWDDQKFIYKNPYIRSFNAGFLKWAFSNLRFSDWYPITWISHALDYAVWGLNPVGHHLTNILLHSVNAFIVVVLTVRLIDVWEKADQEKRPSRTGNFLEDRGKFIAGLTAGLLFGLHPLHVESVAWASERKDVLCGLFFLLSILTYIKYTSSSEFAPSGKHGLLEHPYLFSLVFFAFALMSKPMAVSLPLVLLILDWFPLARIFSLKSLRTAFTEKVPFIILSGCASALTLMAKNGKIISLSALPFNERALVAGRSLALYLWKMAFPLNLVPYYPYPKNLSVLSGGNFMYAFFVIAVTAICIVIAKKNRIWLACWSYFIVTLSPVLGIVQVNKHWMADRYTYLPSLGPFLLAGLGAAWVWEKAARKGHVPKMAAASAGILATLSMSYLTFGQIGVWKNSLIFWNYIIRKEPDKIATAYNNRGYTFEKMGMVGKAITDYNKAISLAPSYVDAYNNRGLAFEKAGQLGKAVKDFNESVSLDPDSPVPYADLGTAFDKMGQTGQAVAYFNKAISLDPSCYSAHFDLARILMRTGRIELAIAQYDKAIASMPLKASAYNGRGAAYGAIGQTGMAIADFSKAIALDPSFKEAYNNRGFAFDKEGENGRAIADYEKSIAMDPSYFLAHYNLADALAKAGRPALAIAEYDKAASINPDVPEVYSSRGYVYMTTGHRKLAILDFQKACKMGDENGCMGLRQMGLKHG